MWLRLWRALNPARRRWVPRSLWWHLRPDIPLVAGHTGTVDGAADFRFRADDSATLNAAFGGGDPAQATDVSYSTTELDTNRRVRIEVTETKGVAETFTPTWQYSLNGGTWTNITTTSSVIRAFTSGQSINGVATTELLAGPNTFVAGEGTEDGVSGSQTLSSQDSEYELCFQVRSADVSAGNTIDLRIDPVGAGASQFTDPPRITITAPPATYETREWRFRDHANFTVAANSTSWGVNQDTVPTLDVGRGFRLRIAIAETAGNGATGESFRLQYRINTGTWADVAVNSPGDSNARGTNAISAVEVRRIQTTSLDNTATTQLLSSPDSFAAGQLNTADITGVGSPASSTTEMEWALWFHRYWYSPTTLNELVDGDTIEFRVQWDDASTWTTIPPATALSNPSVTVNIPNYNVGGLFVENPAPYGGFVVHPSGVRYHIGELAEPTGANVLAVHKSIDGGATWAIQDYANGPTDIDVEGLETFIDGSEIYIFMHNGTALKMFRFGMFDNPTPDQWTDATGETVTTVTAPGDQQVTAAMRSDGTIVCAYTDGAVIEVNVRSAAGSWGTPTTVWNVTNMDSGVQGVLLPTSEDFVMFSVEDINWDLHAKVWTSADALEDLNGTTIAATATGDLIDNNVESKQVASFGLMALSSSSLLVAGIDKTDDDGWVRKITGIGTAHSVGARGADINTTGQIPETIGLGEQPAGSVALHPSTGDVYAVYATEATAEAATNTFRYRVSTDDGATWGTETTIAEASPGRGWGDRVENAIARIFETKGKPTQLGAAASGKVTANATLSFSHTLLAGSNRRVFIAVGWDETGATGLAPSTITYGGVTATLVTDGTTNASANVTSTNQTEVRIYEIKEASLPANGSKTFTVTLDGTPDWIGATVICIQDTAQDTNVGTVAVDTADTGTSPSMSITTDTANSLILHAINGSTAHTGFTATGTDEQVVTSEDESGTAFHVTTKQRTTTAGSYTQSATLGASQSRIAQVSIELRPTGSPAYTLGIIYADASLEQQDDFTGTNARWGGLVTGWTWYHEIDVTGNLSGTGAGSVTVTGGDATGAVTHVGTGAGAVTVTGGDATAKKTAKTTAEGSLTVTGGDASGVRTREGTGAGSLTVTGGDATGAVTRSGTGAGSVTVTGGDATAKKTGKGTGAGAVTVTGGDATARVDFVAAGAVTVTGGDATAKKTGKGTGAGAVTVTGGDATGSVAGNPTGTGEGALTVTGGDATARVDFVAVGSVTVTGGDATAKRTGKGTGAGAITVTGGDATARVDFVAAGAVTVTGGDATAKKTAKGTGAGAIALTGDASGQVQGNKVGTGEGAVTVTGGDATGLHTGVGTGAGAVTVTGGDADTRVTHKRTGEGALTVTGGDATGSVQGNKTGTGAGSFTVTGGDATGLHTGVGTGAGTVTVTGGDATAKKTAKGTGDTTSIVLTGTAFGQGEGNKVGTGEGAVTVTGGDATGQRFAQATGEGAIVIPDGDADARVDFTADGAVVVSGGDATGVATRTATAEGSVTIIPLDPTTQRTAKTTASGAISVSGNNALGRSDTSNFNFDAYMTNRWEAYVRRDRWLTKGVRR